MSVIATMSLAIKHEQASTRREVFRWDLENLESSCRVEITSWGPTRRLRHRLHGAATLMARRLASNVRDGSLAGIAARIGDLRFTPTNGHFQCLHQCLQSAMCGRLPVGKSKRHAASLVGAAMCSAC
jgi:hypothetical protein